MSNHRKDNQTTHATVDARGHVGDAQRVVITQPIRNSFAHFAVAAALLSFIIFTKWLVIPAAISAVLGYLLSMSDVREGRYTSIAAGVLLILASIWHIA